MKVKIDKGQLNLLITLLIFPGYLLLGASFKLVVVPYVVYLVLSRNAAYFPALLVHFMIGTIISQVILVACLFASLLSVRELRRLGLLPIFCLIMLSVPVLMILAYKKMTWSGYDVIETAQHLSLYLGLFAFPYGAVISKTISSREMNQVAILLALVPFLNVFGVVDSYLRYSFFGFSLFASTAIAYPFLRHRLRIPRSLVLGALLFGILLFLGVIQVTFTVVISALLATLLIYLFSIRELNFMSSRFGKIVPVILIGITAYVVLNAGDYTQERGTVQPITEIRNADEAVAALSFKAFVDRGLIWAGTWKMLNREGHLWPPIDVPATRALEAGGQLGEREYGAHNLGLELIRQYGLLVGLIAMIVYVWLLIKCSHVFKLRRTPAISIIFAASIISNGLVGALTGQYVLMNNFSLLLVGSAGLLAGAYSRRTLEHQSSKFGMVSRLET